MMPTLAISYFTFSTPFALLSTAAIMPNVSLFTCGHIAILNEKAK